MQGAAAPKLPCNYAPAAGPDEAPARGAGPSSSPAAPQLPRSCPAAAGPGMAAPRDAGAMAHAELAHPIPPAATSAAPPDDSGSGSGRAQGGEFREAREERSGAVGSHGEAACSASDAAGVLQPGLGARNQGGRKRREGRK